MAAKLSRVSRQAGGPLGTVIYQERLKRELTQDQFGKMFEVSGPAVFKFEKGYVNPSFKLWMAMASEFGLGETKAVLLWVKAKLPVEHHDLLTLKRHRRTAVDLSAITNREELRKMTLQDKTLSSGLRSMVRDNEIWLGYKPTGRELNLLRDFFGQFGDGTKEKYRWALRVLREFTGSED